MTGELDFFDTQGSSETSGADKEGDKENGKPHRRRARGTVSGRRRAGIARAARRSMNAST